jgi:hypothetical protein
MRRWYSSVGKSELYIAQRQLAEHPKIRSSISKVPDYPSIWPEYFRPVWFTSDAIKDLPVTSENAIYMKRAFSHWNASRSELNKVMTRQLVDLFKRDEGDSGSSEVQSKIFVGGGELMVWLYSCRVFTKDCVCQGTFETTS